MIKNIIRIYLILFFVLIVPVYSQTLRDARNYYSVGKYNESLKLIKALLNKEPKNFQLYILGGKNRLKLGDKKKAEANFLLAKKYGAPKNEINRLFKLTSIKKNTAGKSKKKISAPKKNLKEVYKFCSECIAKGDYPTAVNAIRHSLKRYPSDPGLFYYGGIIRFEKGQYDMAIINLKKALKDRGKYFKAFYYLGMIYEKNEKNQDAISNFNQYLKYPLTETEKLNIQKHLLKLSTKKEKKIKEIKKKMKSKSVEIKLDSLNSIFFSDTTNPLELKAYEISSQNKLDMKYDNLIASLTKMVVENPMDKILEEDVNWSISNIFMHMNLPKKALPVLNKLLYEFPRSKRLINYKLSIADVYFFNKEYEKSISYYKNLLRIVKNNDEKKIIYSKLIDIYLSIKSYDKSIKSSLQYIQFLEKNNYSKENIIDVKLNLAKLYLKKFKTSKAKSVLLDIIGENVLKLNSTKDAVLILSDVNYRGGNSQEALKYYKIYNDTYILVDKKDKNATWVIYQIGNCFRNLAKYDDAISYYQRDLKEYSLENQWVKAAKWKFDDTIWQKRFKERMKK